MANIAQAEFFHYAQVKRPPLPAYLQECADWIADGLALAQSDSTAPAHIKTVVRIFDQGGALTQLAERAGAVREYQERLNNELKRGSNREMLLNIQIRRLAKQAFSIRQAALQCAARALRDVVNGKQNFAVGERDHFFRCARDEDRHELLEAVKKSTRLRLFVFEGGSLLSDMNVMIGRVM